MSEMIERAARALANARVRGGYPMAASPKLLGGPMQTQEYIDIAWPLFVGEVLAVMVAIRQPTDEMLAAAELLPQDQATDRGIYTAMIDAMLKAVP